MAAWEKVAPTLHRSTCREETLLDTLFYTPSRGRSRVRVEGGGGGGGERGGTIFTEHCFKLYLNLILCNLIMEPIHVYK